MPKQTSYKGISKRAKLILSLEEGFDIEFKRNSNNLKGEDFVSFANSEYGGTILIGVDEYKDAKGRQKTKIVGCPVGDEPKRALNSKAQQCSPPVELEIFVENENDKPFYRVEIPSGQNKPYCSSGGTYKIRKDGQKESLLPQDLLRMFMAEESGRFLQKFKESTLELRQELKIQNTELIENIQNSSIETQFHMQDILSDMENHLDNVSDEIKRTENEISASLEAIKDENDYGNDYRDEVQDKMKGEIITANDNIIKLAWKLNALLEKFDVEDPEITRKRESIKMFISIEKVKYILEGKKITKREIKKDYQQLISRDSFVRNHFSLEDFILLYKEVEPDKRFLEMSERFQAKMKKNKK